MGHAADHGLPEVVPDTSMQALTNLEAEYKHREMDERDKYPVVYDTAPMIPDSGNAAYYQQHPPSVMSPGGAMPWDSFPAGEGSNGPNGSSRESDTKPRVCGVRRKTFFLLLIAAFVIVAGAIGGGVGGGIAAARARSSSSSDTR
jgi:hypothetical protein